MASFFILPGAINYGIVIFAETEFLCGKENKHYFWRWPLRAWSA